MNELFREYQRFAESLFAASEYDGVVGAFEGANYESEGVYRSEMNCLMFTRTTSFCAVCAEAIDRMIDVYVK